MKFSLGLVSLLLVGCAPSFLRNHHLSNLMSCKNNLTNLAAACQLYAADSGGEYPPSLSQLVAEGKRRYLKEIPHCPSAAADTYSTSYRRKVARRNAYGKVIEGRDEFELCCTGQHHQQAGCPANRPAYHSRRNLIER